MNLTLAASALLAQAPAALAQDAAPSGCDPVEQVCWDAEAGLEASAVVDSFHRALRDGDAAAATALLAEDVVVFEQGGAEMSRDEYVSSHLGADIRYAQQVPQGDSQTTAAVHGDLAFVIRRGEARGTFDTRPVDSVTTETMVLRRHAGVWRIVHIHWSSHKRTPPAA